MHDCGGLMMAVKDSTPNMPKLEMVKDPPWYSSGLSLPSRALPANCLVKVETVAKPLAPTSGMMGVIKPLGVATATEMSAV
ncbi:BZ3500_MvSof-1268-A1-R1_Chr7-1g09176 [Microbotryum saponariae]|uniref:BZ3500_MvSof-1268-A1-R1_Chr7-1g09176 protein n=1 Tax=Microbotryum saponariae TaxID=289078 RepID=A0A2X0L101_9BASI|nr:BZ3501_MvSof-1269-A2-R1_Chr7-1g08881 [Microbotryum saponariae]SDA02942.1 BZ3500_MvSof-1268-A1-R1_Chr7-1g09176 [Microbotryum saponariae]